VPAILLDDRWWTFRRVRPHYWLSVPHRAIVLAVLEEHWPMWDSPERIAIFAQLPIDLTEDALEALGNEGRAVQDGDLWRAKAEGESELTR
jgi:hypothetical protein